MQHVVVIKTYTTRPDAEVAKSALEGSGIHAFIEGDDAGGMYPFMTEGIRLFVKKTDVTEAKKILNIKTNTDSRLRGNDKKKQ